ncbi:helix-turn-helix transcriptional regulator [Mycolicibacterium sp. P9-64]|uniref:helix-turn-helix transcriptional regulator n=1 Tax=Mycolicibacterium sp. P9-64 TaxID=2024612 RepID=UPI0011EEF72F|nr:LuxR family transcriptional regulator [Mycolicibacterium sp. P9-64]KAA0079074.1 helix-turn-helix transcriptional regulator [Mycolicibacterium sp. P9-64]
MRLFGRDAECAALAALVDAVRTGESRALLLHGEAGVGKTALLDRLAEQAADDCLVLRAAGVESEMELAFATLHQLCAPMVGRLDDLPRPQRDALRTAFGISTGPPPDRFLVAMAVLSLFSDLADERPLLLLIDDEQWLDQASSDVLALIAGRLKAESVAIVYTARVPSAHLAGLPHLPVTGLATADALELLDAALTAPLDPQIRSRLVAETRGNPLALLELPRGMTPLEMVGGFGLPAAGAFAGGAEESFRRRLDALPESTRHLLLVAAAETAGDPTLVWRAAALLGVGPDAATSATDADLVEFGTPIRFRHPLVRSVLYRSASASDRREVHRALAEVTDPHLDADRRAWHLAEATVGPDEDVAVELERSADRAKARGGRAAAAAFLERATMLTLSRAQRAGRAVAAAAANVDAGALDPALHMVAVADVGPLTELQRSRLDMIRAQLAFVTNRGRDAPPLLLQAARRLEHIDANLARDTYLDAFSAAWFAGRLTVGGNAWEVARHAGAAPRPPHDARAHDLFLDGVAAHYNDGYAAGVPLLRNGLSVFSRNISAEEELRWLWLASNAAIHVWDDARWDELSKRHVQLARDRGALSELPLALSSRAFAVMLAGDLPAAAALIDETRAVTEVTGSSLASSGALGLAAFRGRAAEVGTLSESTLRDATRRGEGYGITHVEWANAVLNNGAGRYQEALGAAQRCSAYPGDFAGLSAWSYVELVEAAVRSGMNDDAADGLHRIHEFASASGTDWALGVEARSGGLLNEGDTAEVLYREAIERLGRTRVRVELARAHLVYGEWLRRERRRADAREQLRTAYDMFEAMGMVAFADRAGRELRATGETARKRTEVERTERLTAQEMQVAQLARDGLSNPEIGGRLFLSPRTVQYHLRNVFTKLDIVSRSQLDGTISESGSAG